MCVIDQPSAIEHRLCSIKLLSINSFDRKFDIALYDFFESSSGFDIACIKPEYRRKIDIGIVFFGIEQLVFLDRKLRRFK